MPPSLPVRSMAPRPVALAAPLLAVCAAALLAISGPANALYVVTPLTLTFSAQEAEAGDVITLTLGPNEDHENASTYAGQDVRIQYSWSANEGQDPENSSSDADEVTGIAGQITLDGEARGSFTWQLPAESDDHNVFFTILAADDEPLAHGHVRVGDAEPIMAIMAGGSDDGAIAETGPVDSTPAQDASSEGSGNAVPAAGVALLLGALGAVALALARRR